MPDREPLLDRVRRQLAGEEAPPVTRPGDPPLVTRCNWCSPDGTPDAAHHPGGQVEHVTGDPLLVAGQPGLVTRPHDWPGGPDDPPPITDPAGMRALLERALSPTTTTIHRVDAVSLLMRALGVLVYDLAGQVGRDVPDEHPVDG